MSKRKAIVVEMSDDEDGTPFFFRKSVTAAPAAKRRASAPATAPKITGYKFHVFPDNKPPKPIFCVIVDSATKQEILPSGEKLERGQSQISAFFKAT